jgi:peptidoglycan/LPS O-acetylase OafA/YrhL
VLWIAWLLVSGQPIGMKELVHGVVSHVLLIHNLLPNDFLLINDALWNVGLEFQTYLLFAFVMLPLMRRFGPWGQFAVMLVVSVAPHFLFRGFLDWTRPWFVALFSFGVATMAISNTTRPGLQRYETRVPWGAVWLVATLLVPIAVWKSGLDTPYGAGILQNLLLGLAVASFFTFTRLGAPGPIGGIARRVIAFLDWKPLRQIGVYSYSLFLIHYPLLRLLCGIAARFTESCWILGTLAILVFAPITLFAAYRFHLAFERPFQVVRGNAADQELAAERSGAPAQTFA